MPRDPRIDPQPEDVIQVRPWQKVYTRTVIERYTDGYGQDLVVYTCPEEWPNGNRVRVSLEQWQEDAKRPIEISPEEAVAFEKFSEGVLINGLAEEKARADGYHCLSCAGDKEADRYTDEALYELRADLKFEWSD